MASTSSLPVQTVSDGRRRRGSSDLVASPFCLGRTEVASVGRTTGGSGAFPVFPAFRSAGSLGRCTSTKVSCWRGAGMASTDLGVGLAEAVEQVRAELEDAIKRGAASSVAFEAGPVEMEFEV